MPLVQTGMAQPGNAGPSVPSIPHHHAAQGQGCPAPCHGVCLECRHEEALHNVSSRLGLSVFFVPLVEASWTLRRFSFCTLIA